MIILQDYPGEEYYQTHKLPTIKIPKEIGSTFSSKICHILNDFFGLSEINY